MQVPSFLCDTSLSVFTFYQQDLSILSLPTMYCNFTKTHGFPLIFRVSTRPRCSKPSKTFNIQTFSNGFGQKTIENTCGSKPRSASTWLGHKAIGSSYCVKPRNFSTGFCQISSESRNGPKPRIYSNGFHQKTSGNCYGHKHRSLSSGFYRVISENRYGEKPRIVINGLHLKTLGITNGIRHRNFSNQLNDNAIDNNSRVRGTRTLPWIASYKKRESKESGKMRAEKSSQSSWEDSANIYFSRTGARPSSIGDKESRAQTVYDVENGGNGRTKMDKNERQSTVTSSRSSCANSANRSHRSGTERLNGKRESRSRTSDDIDKGGISTQIENEEEEEGVDEPVDDPRWDRIKSNFNRFIERDVRSEKPEVQRWSKQENWGKKTWKEATASTMPKMVGEAVYGVGPVLAALTVARREFYTLYFQEGMDLSGNNRKKKDKKGVEKVLRIAEQIGLTVKETSKHDLNMIVDNRPHQGLVLDASPLEMVSTRYLEPVSVEGDKAPLWVALDEVTDPQNLGGIIRSAYFFGASGVVLCAKNSAPLSGVVSKASAGSLELIELRYCKNMMQFLSNSADNGWRVLGGSVSSRALPLNAVVAGEPTILVLGSEGRGLRPLVEKSCTQLIKIPGDIPLDVAARDIEGEEVEKIDLRCSGEEFRSFMAVESLNVSVAAGVLLYHLVGNTNSLGDKQPDVIE